MTEPAPPARTRIGTAERDAALDALGEHMRAGRLDPDEYTERATRLSVARYLEDLTPLFQDLPAGVPAAVSRSGASGTPVPVVGGQHAAEPFAARHGGRVMAAIGPVCLLLFFVFGFAGGWSWSWLFFLVPPIVGGVLYGDVRASRQRDRKRPAG
ncbi:MAG: hypothetical protein QOH56_3380 [Pseudonocardiales bacterium]|jgi:hypothetical protein|nr:hypothetical protein [Pseudonocardiales bacterium]MDQ1737129.1 hypothetical protein [Pseudonocardiales bacterium]